VVAEAEEVGEWMGKKKRHGGKRSRKIPLMATLGAASGLMSAYAFAGGFNDKLPAAIVSRYTGYYIPNHTWNFDYCKDTWFALGVGALGSILASKLGVNRMISGIPFVKL